MEEKWKFGEKSLEVAGQARDEDFVMRTIVLSGLRRTVHEAAQGCFLGNMSEGKRKSITFAVGIDIKRALRPDFLTTKSGKF